ncbi:hypothetical protein [Rhizobium sp. 18065]|uniref:hypothetical protein n=1 Tax=Rhizobium sp. 18065 TaxID=2681411 RepID=UPI00135694C3|nr:hypothetical protein [Rhizobium sp. 18065]
MAEFVVGHLWKKGRADDRVFQSHFTRIISKKVLDSDGCRHAHLKSDEPGARR